MRFKRIRYFWVSTLMLSSLSPGLDLNPGDQDAQVVRMTARKYEFAPSQVHVKLGVKVQLKITAIDRDHGLTIVRDPVGENSSPHPGLVFTSPGGGDGWRLNRGKEATIEFVARAPGTYKFSCSLVCGIHHGRMNGYLIVDPSTPCSSPTTDFPDGSQALCKLHDRKNVDRPDHTPLWRCPKCGASMAVVERFTAAQLELRSPPLLATLGELLYPSLAPFNLHMSRVRRASCFLLTAFSNATPNTFFQP